MGHCIITGGADGIGRALVERYARAGHAVTIIDRDAARAHQLCTAIEAAGGDASFIAADLSDRRSIDDALAALRRLPRADLVVHCAGISAVGRFAESDLAQQSTVLNVNLRAPLQITAGLLRDGRVVGGGTLVFIASLSVFTGYPGAAAYAASKDGIAAFARSLRVALAPQAINVLTVYPGPTRTAHARRYSPDNRREARRMPPDQLAELIEAAVLRRRAQLIPGIGNQLAATMGRVLPGLAELIMRKTILEKLPSAREGYAEPR